MRIDEAITQKAISYRTQNLELTQEQISLINKHIKFCFWLGHKWSRKLNDKSIFDDIVSNCEFALIKAAKNYKKNTETKFTTYCISCMENEIRGFLKKRNKYPINFSNLSHPTSDSFEMELERMIKELQAADDILTKISVEKLLKQLTDKEFNVIDLYFFQGYTEIEIASIMDMSQGNISKIKSHALDKMRNYANV